MRNEIKAIVSRLRGIKSLVELYHTKAETDADGDRVDRLEAEIDLIQEAIEKLEEIE